MPEGYPIQTNFTSGEVSPLLRGRVDINRYFNGVAKLRNFLVKPQGGIIRRSGTRFVDSAKYPGEDAVLIRFEFNVAQSYILVFGRQYIWIILNGAVIKVLGVPVEIATPYLEADLRGIYVTQSADVMYICHPKYPTKTLSRLSDTNWILADYVHNDGPYLDLDNRGYQMKLTNIVNTAVLHDTAADFTNAGPFAAVGKMVEYQDGERRKIALVTGYTDANTLTISPKENIVYLEDLDSRCTYTYVPGITAVNGAIKTNPANVTWTFDANATYNAGTHVMTFTVPTTYNLPSGIGVQYVPANGWPNRIRASVAVWSSSHETCYVRLPSTGEWLLTDSHLPQAENYNANPGGTTSADIMTVSALQSMVPAAVTGIISVDTRVRTATLTCSNNVFAATDVGRQVRLFFGLEVVWCTITAYTDAKTVSVNLGRLVPPDPDRVSGLKNDAATTEWQLGAWYTNNYPTVCLFHEERLCFLSTPLQPQNVWMSKSGDFVNMAPTDEQSIVTDDSAINITIASGIINSAVWALSSGSMLIGTIGSEWQTKASSLNQAITPSNISAQEQTSYGSMSTFRPHKVGQSVLFCQRTGLKIRELVYDYQFDSYVGHDLSIVSEHILKNRGGALCSAYQKDPNSILWMTTITGQLVGMTYEKDQEVVAWHAHDLGGTYRGGNAFAFSVATMPHQDGRSDVLYMVVKRTVNSIDSTHIELMEREFDADSGSILSTMFFVDAGLTYQGVPVNTVGGLNHLIGESVQVVADGTFRGTYVVNGSGQVTFTGTAAFTVHAGLQMTSIMGTLPWESGSVSGTAQGKIKRIQTVILRLRDSLKFSLGPDEAHLKPMSFRDDNSTVDSPNLFSGDKIHDLSASPDFQAQFSVVQNNPYPLAIIAMMPQLHTNT